MDIELLEIRDFLKEHHPFDLLPGDALDALPQAIKVGYARREHVVLAPGDRCEYLYIVRTGAVETRTPDGQLLARLSEGECFGVHAMLAGGTVVNRATAIEDSLLYQLPAPEFERMRRDYPQFAFFFAPLGGDRLREAQTHGHRDSAEQIGMMARRLGDLLKRPPLTIDRNASIQQAAQEMRDHRVSCLLVTAEGQLAGIITDRDLRSRVVAAGLPIDRPVSAIMTVDPVALSTEDYMFDALLTMVQRNIHHLPVLRDGDVAGVITDTNIIEQQATSVVHLVGDIFKASSHDGLATLVQDIPKVLLSLIDARTSAEHTGHIITSIADATTTRLLQLAEEKLGPAPIPYLWVASGSQARHEQTGVSDQDNGLILDDSFDPARHGDYFKALADFVCDGLHACGYVYCPGEIMAKTDQWRQPLAVWRKYFTQWIEEPEPKALMLSCIFFDLRPVWGEKALYEELQKLILAKAQTNRLFLAHMVGNALTHTPPLGFFRNFVLIRGGAHNHQFDLKHNGVVPVVDIARIAALDAGIEEVNTYARLRSEQKTNLVSPTGIRDLLDAFEFIAETRLKHQAEQIRQGQKPDNFMSPEDLSHFERNHLKDAFAVIKTIQSALASKFQMG